MREVTESVRVQAQAAFLWREAGGFGAVGKWHPMLDRVETAGDGVGATRIAHGKDGSTQVERLQAISPVRHVYRYVLEKTPMPVRDYTAEFRIDDAGAGASLVTWSAGFSLADGGGDETMASVRRFLRAGLENLEAKYGTGTRS